MTKRQRDFRILGEIILLAVSIAMIVLGVIFIDKFWWLIIPGSIYLLIFLVSSIYLLIFKSMYMSVKVTGTSMVPSLKEGSNELILKCSNWDDEKKKALLESMDIIIVSTKDYQKDPKDPRVKIPFASKDERYIKRLVLIGGGYVKCDKGTIYVKDKKSQPWKFWGSVDHYAPYFHFSEYKVGSDEIFFVGDNLTHSSDSRFRENRSHLNCLYKIKDIEGVRVTDQLGDKKDLIMSRIAKYSVEGD